MKHAIYIAIALIGLCVPPSIYAGSASFMGNEMLPACKSAVAFLDQYATDKTTTERMPNAALGCIGYVHGFLDGVVQSKIQRFWAKYPNTENKLEVVTPRLAAFEKAEEAWCKPSGVTNAQVVRLVVQHMERNPELLHLNFSLLLGQVLEKTFPCQPTKDLKPSQK